MNGFGSSGRFSSGSNKDKDIVCGKIKDIKVAPDGGCKRIIAKEKGTGKNFAVDVTMAEAKKLERKENYAFRVEEKTEDRYGGGMASKRTSNFRTYYCDETPEKNGRPGGHGMYRDFSGRD